MQAKIAVIGSDSFIAKYIVKALSSEFQITGFSKNNITNVKNHIVFDYPNINLDFNTLLIFDHIIYCAGAGIQNSKNDTSLVYDLNTFLPIEIVLFLNSNTYKGKFITFGSYFEIGNNSQDKMYSENDIVSSLLTVPNHYCSSKRLLSRFFHSSQLSIKYYHLILPTIFGKGENENRLIPYLVNSLINLKDPLLTSGRQVRQYLHAFDLSDLVKTIIKMDLTGDIYNIPSKETVQVNNIVEQVYSILNIEKAEANNVTIRYDESMQHLELNSIKLSSLIPFWEPTISVKSGIQEYIN